MCGFIGPQISATNTSVTTTVPPGVITGSVGIDQYPVFSNPLDFTVTAPPPPIVDAGPNQGAPVGTTVQLDGTGSYDVNGHPLTYQWTMTSTPDGNTNILSDPMSPRPTFVAALPGEYRAQLTVNNGQTSSISGIMAIRANRLARPMRYMSWRTTSTLILIRTLVPTRP